MDYTKIAYIGERDAKYAKVINSVSVAAGGVVTHSGFNVTGFKDIEVMVSSTGNVTVYPQVSYDNSTWYDIKAEDDSDLAYNCNNENIAFAVNHHAKYFRVVIYATSTSTVTVELYAQC
ncbi:MAG: hypothetical protein DRO95_03175 [Candidatus Altiarchaeales archaeon]|nr:MAG: hypothetical protein DRO95_03175 [Candidatus Altiarchaeales archaeon]